MLNLRPYCYIIVSMKIIPDRNEFEVYFFSHSNEEVAEHFGVCKTTVYHWARIFGTQRKRNKYKDTLITSFSNLQEQILIGSLLGDGSLGKVVGNEQSFYRELHGVLQEEYIRWKYELLKPFSVNVKKCVNNKKYQAYILRTMRHPLFTELENLWYLRDCQNNYVLKNGRRIKILPSDVKLTPITIAVWYCDDGWKPKKDNQFYFSTHGFSLQEVERLVVLLRGFGLNCRVRMRTKKRLPEIVVLAESKFDFVELLKPHMPCKSLFYKLGLR